MSRIVKIFIDNSHLEFDKGGFDNWCVYYVDDKGCKRPPLDVDYFKQLKELSDKYGVERVYSDFVSIYDKTTKSIEVTVLNFINELADSYEKSLTVNKLFTTLYMAMIAEENYPNTKLGRKIKRLGVFEMLFGNREISDAANFMRGMSWRYINDLCRQRGF